MANNNFSFLTVVVVALIVAVIASLITATITGNVIKVKEEKKGTEIYTKEEIDTKLKDITINQGTTNQGVLDMMNKCSIVAVASGGSDSTILKSCSETCKYYQETCVLASIKGNNISNGNLISTGLFDCSRDYDSIWRGRRISLDCVCCSP